MKKDEELQKLIYWLSESTLKYNELSKGGGAKPELFSLRMQIKNLQAAIEFIKAEKEG